MNSILNSAPDFFLFPRTRFFCLLRPLHGQLLTGLMSSKCQHLLASLDPSSPLFVEWSGVDIKTFKKSEKEDGTWKAYTSPTTTQFWRKDAGSRFVVQECTLWQSTGAKISEIYEGVALYMNRDWICHTVMSRLYERLLSPQKNHPLCELSIITNHGQRHTQ